MGIASDVVKKVLDEDAVLTLGAKIVGPPLARPHDRFVSPAFESHALSRVYPNQAQRLS